MSKEILKSIEDLCKSVAHYANNGQQGDTLNALTALTTVANVFKVVISAQQNSMEPLGNNTQQPLQAPPSAPAEAH